MAILARINRIIRVDAEPHTPDMALELVPADEDLGEAVTREVREDDSRGMNTVSDEAVFKPIGMATHKRATPLRSKRRRGVANAIDDLFSTIL
jgi:hypothetical protein